MLSKETDDLLIHEDCVGEGKTGFKGPRVGGPLFLILTLESGKRAQRAAYQ